MRILITDGDTRPALAATRSLGQRGHFIVTLADVPHSLASASRYSSVSVCSPSPSVHPEEYLDSIIEAAKLHQIDVLLPINEISTLLLALHRERLPDRCRLPFADYESLRLASSKVDVLRLANDLGVPVPKSHILTSALTTFDDLPESLFPMVVKPARSRVLTRQGWLSSSVSYVRDVDSLLDHLRALPEQLFPVLLQERIYGEGVGVFMLFDRGRCVARFSHRRLREKPPSGGVSVLCESVEADPVAAAHSECLLKQLSWHGPAMVEFKRDRRDGTLRLMEINARFWGSLQLAIDAGVDFPALLVDMARGAVPAPVFAYRTGVRSRWLGGDLDSLLMMWLKRRSELNLPPSHPGRFRVTLDFVHLLRRSERMEIERWNDRGPAYLEWRRRLLRH